MNINRNTMGHLEVPDFILTKASGERVGVLQCTHKVWNKKYNDIDTLSFEIPYMKDDVLTKFYDDIDIMKYIEVPTLSASFAIKDIDIENEGQKTEYKKVECQSRECLLGQKYLENFIINEGTTGSIDEVSFCNSGLQSKSLVHLVLEKFPDWTISSQISSSLKTMERSFTVTRQSVYDFLVKDVSEAFECIFVFDSLNKTIGAYTQEEYGIDCNVHVNYNSLLQNTSMSYSIDDIKTAITLQGKDDTVNVREINIGYDSIYNFDYYASEEYMSSSLLSAYNTWKNLPSSVVDTSLFTYKTGVITKAEVQGKTYTQVYDILRTKYQNYYTQISKWQSTMIPDGVNTRHPGYGKILYKNSSGTDYYVTFARQTKWMLVGSGEQNKTIDANKKVYTASSLPSTGDTETLYLMKNTNTMKRWLNNQYYDVNTWIDCCLSTLKEHQAAAEKNEAVAMQAEYGDRSKNEAEYIRTYLPQLYAYNALAAQIIVVDSTLTTLNENQEVIKTDKSVVVNKLDMKNNFTLAQLKELSAFIREDEISSSNYAITDSMTEEKRFEMLYALLDYGQKELAKVATPQIQFSAGLNNLYAIPEFDNYSGDFDIGNYVWVTLRDDYSIKAKILEIELDFLDQSNFSVTFGNIKKKAKNIFTDVTEALNAATSAATSVSFNASNWNASAEDTDSIGKALANGLLSQSYYLSNAEDNETLIDENGVWITTTTGAHGRQQTGNYDAIYLGGGRILFTDDGWRSVRMSMGRTDVDFPHVDSSGNISFVTESRFGVFADFLIAGYVGGSMIVGGDIYSDKYSSNASDKNKGNYGTHINLKEGTFEFNSPQSFITAGKDGKKRLRLYVGKDDSNNDIDILEMNGVIHAKEGNIGSDDNGAGGFIIKNKKLYMTKESFNQTSNGIYIGFDSTNQKQQGISLGSYNSTLQTNPFSVDVTGYLTSRSGLIGGFNITDKELYNGKTSFDGATVGIYMNSSSDGGISLGKYDSSKGGNPFSVSMAGYLTANSGKIGGFNITNTYLANGKDALNTATDGVYLGTNGISLGASTYDSDTQKWTSHKFRVDKTGSLYSTSGTIGGFTIKDDRLYNGKSSLTNANAGVYIGTNGISLGYNTDLKKTPFSVTDAGVLTSISGTIGGWSITDTMLSHGKIKIDTTTDGGQLNFNNKFIVYNDGDFTASNGKFKVDKNGVIESTAGVIGGVNIGPLYKDGKAVSSKYALYTHSKNALDSNEEGFHISDDGISLGKSTQNTTTQEWTHKFKVDKSGKLYSTSGIIGGWTISTSAISHTATVKIDGKDVDQTIKIDASNNRLSFNNNFIVYGDGTFVADNGLFKVTKGGKITAQSGTIGGYTIGPLYRANATTGAAEIVEGRYALYTGSKNALDSTNSGVHISSDGISLGSSSFNSTTKEWSHKFRVSNAGDLYSTSGQIGGFTITTSKLYSGKSSMSDENKGVYIGTNGIALGYDSTLTSTNKSPFRVTSDGVLTAKSGTIGGATIEANSIKASNGKWEINSDGSATFSKITLKTSVDISGVNKGSTFGNFGYDDNGHTWGNFSSKANSFFGSNNDDPFGGTCVTKIQTLAAGEITADRVKTAALEAGFITAETIKANYVQTSTLTADYITAKQISNTYATISSLNAHHIKADHLDAGTVNGTAVEWRTVSVCYEVSVDGDYYDVGGQTIHIVTSVEPSYYTKMIMTNG